jgi:thiol-disulfide isomerase/thioredoxin
MALGLLTAVPTVHAAQVVRWNFGNTPVLAFDTLDGKRFDSAALSGKVVVANFWAVWCAPCREEMPVLAQLAASTRGQPVEYLLVNTGDSNNAIERMRNKMPPGMTSLRLSADALDFRFSSLPATVVFDKRMRARWVVRGAMDAQGEPLRSLVADLMAENNVDSVKPLNTLLREAH